MTINALKDGECGVITHLGVDEQLRDRFFSFGISKAKRIKKLETSLGGSTILVELDRNCIVLRAEEANAIQVERVQG
ncbi:MAG: ferrous iron transport protein A [Helicobacter sp.]|uniref:FeoA family protein n=1 Tax=Helicobacter sp. TaxID=218 RepID=UPI0023D1222A|nr:FeoA family protein [Helicobacter sp.]MDE7175562.1 ferrous iron transport protein A [Helicobacter sp.]